jgi:hypothetical protein
LVPGWTHKSIGQQGQAAGSLGRGKYRQSQVRRDAPIPISSTTDKAVLVDVQLPTCLSSVAALRLEDDSEEHIPSGTFVRGGSSELVSTSAACSRRLPLSPVSTRHGPLQHNALVTVTWLHAPPNTPRLVWRPHVIVFLVVTDRPSGHVSHRVSTRRVERQHVRGKARNE